MVTGKSSVFLLAAVTFAKILGFKISMQRILFYPSQFVLARGIFRDEKK